MHGTGALLKFLPPYSPDLNPTKGSYHQAKEFIRENDITFCCCFQPRMFILHAFGQISPENCEAYFRICGYELLIRRVLINGRNGNTIIQH